MSDNNINGYNISICWPDSPETMEYDHCDTYQGAIALRYKLSLQGFKVAIYAA